MGINCFYVRTYQWIKLISGYTIIQFPGFLRACYMTIRRYPSEREENKKKKTNKTEVEEMQLDQTDTKSEPPQVGKEETLNMRNYLNLKLQVIHNLEQLPTINDQEVVRKSDVLEMVTKEIDLLTQVLDK